MSCQPSAISRQLLAFRGQLSVVSFSLITHYALLITVFIAFALAAVSAAHAAETIYLINDYRYASASAADDRDIGHSLCGTRCNALATNFSNIMEPGGWSLVRVSSNKEITVELNSPFLGGQCICLVDEYSVKITNPGGPRDQRSAVKEKASVQ